MGNLRGLIKIDASSGPQLGYLMVDMNEWLSEIGPAVTGIKNWLLGKRGGYDEYRAHTDNQRFSTAIAGGYLLYADDLEVLFHNTGTVGFNATAQGGSGPDDPPVMGPGCVQTNEAPFREIKFNTTLSQRDPDNLETIWEPFKKGSWNPVEYISAGITTGIDRTLGISQMKAYFKRRATFMRDMDNVQITCSSTMFMPLSGYCNASMMRMQAGATEATYEVNIKELMNVVPQGATEVSHSMTVEPGLGFFY